MTTERSRHQIYRDNLRGGPPRKLARHGTYAAARRHERAGEPLCPRCKRTLKSHYREKNERRKSRES